MLDEKKIKEIVCHKCSSRQCNPETCLISDFVLDRQELIEQQSLKEQDLKQQIQNLDGELQYLRKGICTFKTLRNTVKSWFVSK